MVVQNKVEGLIKARNKILKQLTSKGLGHSDAEEIFQSSLVQAITKLDQLRDNSKFEYWFNKILRNQLYDYFRKEKKDSILERELENKVSFFIDNLESSFCQCILKLIETLKPEYNEVLKYRLVEGHSVKDTSKALEVSENVVKVRTHRAKEEMKEKLVECCGIKNLADASRCECD